MTRRFPFPGNQASPEDICKHLRLLIAITGFVLVWQTWPLWFGTPAIFPHVPLISWFVGSPAWCDWGAGGLMVLSLAMIFFFPDWGKVTPTASLTFAGAFVFAVCLNQQRLQPWAFEFCILLLVMTLLPPPKAVPCLRLVVASIYLHSGLSKLDVTFLTTHGEAFVSVATNALGWDLSSAPVEVRRFLVAMLPLGEILVAGGLLLPQTRRLAKWGSVGMHVMLLGILGPWGLGHKPGVLIWNLFFIGQNLLLFRSDQNLGSEPHPVPSKRILGGYGFVAAVVLLPFLEPVGWYDHWPAWAVYASRPARTRVYVAEHRVRELPAEIQEHVTEETPADAAERFLAGQQPLQRLMVDRWSLEGLNAPIYPQSRFQIGVALALAEAHQLEEDLRVEIDSPADRWTGKRTTRILQGRQAVRETAGQFHFNALPR